MRASRTDIRRSSGYSLAEVLVATAIFAVMIVAALMIYDRSNRIFKNSVESGDMQQNTRIGFEKLVADIRMAGYDFDRDGEASIANTYQQPDEQLEYIGTHAAVVRGNYDAELGLSDDVQNGRDKDYQPTGGEFPVVTTGNDEIVAYALKSDKGTNTDSITFYADTKKPRATYPGGSDEQTVTIPGVNLCTNGCVDPPYTLYRITLKPVTLTNPALASNFTYTPIANNVRSLEFRYFNDPAGSIEVTPNLGAGKVLVSGATPTADMQARALRETIQSIRVSLTGMNATSSPDYVSPIEAALPSAQQVARNYRQVALSSLILPRNLGRRGMEEYATTPPGAPTVTGVEYGCCGIMKVSWSAPPYGIVDGYNIIWDTSATGSFGSVPTPAGTALSGYVAGLDPSVAYFFMVVASNSYGSERSTNVFPPAAPGVKPINRTHSGPPTNTAATSDPAGNKINLAFKAPLVNNTNGGGVLTLSGGSPADSLELPTEITGYDIVRAPSAGVTPFAAGSVTVWNTATLTPAGSPAAGAPAYSPATGSYAFVDDKPKLNCTTYYYRIRAWEKCRAATAQNSTGNIALSNGDWATEFSGSSVAAAAPAQPGPLSMGGLSTCSTNPCTIIPSWPKVTLDLSTPQQTIQTPKYLLRRVTLDNGVLVSGSTKEWPITDSDPTGAAALTFTDNTAPKPANPNIIYSYTVQAQQACTAPALDSIFSIAKAFPCMTVTVNPPSGVMDGAGTAASPWVITSPTGTVTATTSQPIATAVAKLYTAGGTYISDITSPGKTGANTAAFDVPLALNDGTTYQVDLYITDTNGCTDLQRVYMYDSPTGCCLAPWKRPDGNPFDSTIVTTATATTALSTNTALYNYKALSNSLIVKLRNLCGETLTITGLTIYYNASKGQSLQGIAYPDTGTGAVGVAYGGGGFTSGATINTFPSGMKMTIPASASTYKIQLNFKDPNASDLPKDLTGFCVAYNRTKLDGTVESNTNCRIAPMPAVTPGTCNP